jgi:splicing factor 3A subunit 1
MVVVSLFHCWHRTIGGVTATAGDDFRAKIYEQKRGDPKFEFLQPSSPYHVYFDHKVKLIREGKEDENAPSMVNIMDEAADEAAAERADGKVFLKDPPPMAKFLLDPPYMPAEDLEIIKLTSQFVVKHKGPFLEKLRKRE